ncbi:MAG TPA: hypothetical protein VHP33_32045, partial [Polyangiaceae bacterium]|nr:hypothetical protein [Polyangiaceae bacterium]
MKTRWSVLLTGVTLSGAFLATQARAGDGSIQFDPPDDQGIVRKASLSTKVYVALPRTQAQMDAFIAQAKLASQMLCDASDGTFRIGNVEVISNPIDRKRADVWWIPGPGRAYASGAFGLGGVSPAATKEQLEACYQARRLGNACSATPLVAQCDRPEQVAVGNRLGHLLMFGDNGLRGDVLAHEFGHLAFGLADLYPDPFAGDPRGGVHYYNGAGLDGLSLVPDTYSGSNSGLSFFRPVAYDASVQAWPTPFKDILFKSPPPTT